MKEKITHFKDATESTSFLLWRTYLAWKRSMEAILTPHNLTHVQFILLASIWYLSDKEVTQKELANFTYCDVAMTSQVVRQLEKKGFIARIQKEGDDRAKYPQLTKKGLTVLKAAMHDVEEIDHNFFAPLKSSRSGLHDALLKLAEQ